MTRSSDTKSSLLLIVDDWEALERYEERFASGFDELEACPMPKEGLLRARDRSWSVILLDLTLEDVTPREAMAFLKSDSRTSTVPLVVVGSSEELLDLELLPSDRKVFRPFDWRILAEVVAELR
jgi:CheY-like chemotaxis protein